MKGFKYKKYRVIYLYGMFRGVEVLPQDFRKLVSHQLTMIGIEKLSLFAKENSRFLDTERYKEVLIVTSSIVITNELSYAYESQSGLLTTDQKLLTEYKLSFG